MFGAGVALLLTNWCSHGSLGVSAGLAFRFEKTSTRLQTTTRKMMRAAHVAVTSGHSEIMNLGCGPISIVCPTVSTWSILSKFTGKFFSFFFL